MSRSSSALQKVLKTAIESAANEKVMIAGTGIESASETLRLTEYAYDIGYDVAMVRTPHYYKGQMANPANMLAFYRFVCDRSPLPVIIYNFPQATSYDIPAELVIELAEHPNLIGIKESSGSIEKVQKMVEGTRHIKRTAIENKEFESEPRYEAIELPRNSPTGFVTAFFATLTGFSLVWHIWWLMGAGLIGAYAVFVWFAWRNVAEYEVSAEDVARVDATRRAAQRAWLERGGQAA